VCVIVSSELSERADPQGFFHPWNATPAFDVSAIPPAAYPVPSRLSWMMSLSLTALSQTIHCFASFTSESVHVLHTTCEHGRIRNMWVLFENPFLHEGHIASRSSSGFAFSDGGAAALGGVRVNDTGMRSCRAIECAGFPPRHVVCTFTSFRFLGGPDEVYVGVRLGSQKSGSLCFRFSACSRSIWRRAASSASCANLSTSVLSKLNLRLSPCAVDAEMHS